MAKRLIPLCLCTLLWCNNPAFAQFAGGEEITSYQTDTHKKNSSKVFTKGYKGTFEWGTSIGTEPGSDDTFIGIAGFCTSHGYQFNPYLYTGVGIGLSTSYDVYGSDETIFMPVFVECRINMLNPNQTRNTPFIGIQLGGDFEVIYGAHGFFFHPRLGYRFPFRKAGRSAFTLSLGYQLEDFYGFLTHMGAFRLGFDF